MSLLVSLLFPSYFTGFPLDGESTAAVPFFLIGRLCLFPSSPFSLEGGTVIPRVTGNPRGFLFILLFGEKNEPRRTAARNRAFSLGRRRLARGLRNSLRSHSPRPLSALFPPSRPDKGGFSFFPICVSLLVSLLFPSYFTGFLLDGESTAMVVFCYDRGILGGCTSQWAKSIPHLNFLMLFWLLHVLARRLCGTN